MAVFSNSKNVGAQSVTAGESLSQYDVVYCKSSDNKYYKSFHSGTAEQANAVGIVTQTEGIAQNSTGNIVPMSKITNNGWSFTPGLPLFLGATSGSITQTEPTSSGDYWVPLGYAISATSIWFQIGTGILIGASTNNIISNGTQANRPTAGVQGRLFIPIDGYEFSYDNGSSWDVYVEGFKCSNPPDASSLTAVNNSTVVTLEDDGDGLLITQLGSASTAERCCHFLTLVPSAPYTFEVIMQPLYLYPVSWVQIGIVLTDGTNIAASKSVRFMLCFGTAGFPTLSATAQTNGTTGTVYLEQIHSCTALLQKYVWFRIRDDATTRYFDFSGDGRNWEPYFSHGRTTHITPTYIGLSVEQGGTSVAASIVRSRHRIVHWYLGA